MVAIVIFNIGLVIFALGILYSPVLSKELKQCFHIKVYETGSKFTDQESWSLRFSATGCVLGPAVMFSSINGIPLF